MGDKCTLIGLNNIILIIGCSMWRGWQADHVLCPPGCLHSAAHVMLFLRASTPSPLLLHKANRLIGACVRVRGESCECAHDKLGNDELHYYSDIRVCCTAR